MTILPKRNKRRIEQREQESSQHGHLAISGVNSREGSTTGSAGSSTVSHVVTHGNVPASAGLNVAHSALYQSLPLRLDTHRSNQGSESRRNRKSPPIRPTTGAEESHSSVPQKKRRKQQSSLGSTAPSAITADHQKDIRNVASTSKFAHSGSTMGPARAAPTLTSPAKSSTEHLMTSHTLPGGSRDTADRPDSTNSRTDLNTSDDEYQQRSPGGCNSEDEYGPSPFPSHTEEERSFETQLKKELGLIIKQMETDGSCLFRAVADQVYGDQDMHDAVRSHCIDYMAKNADHFSHYVTEDYNAYLRRKRQLGCHGNHVEVQALSEMYNRPIEVYQYSLQPINIFNGPYSAESAYPIRLSYHGNTHYNSLVDPNKASVGVGLGLPGFKPGLAEQNLLSDAVRKSEEMQLEQTMLQDKIRETDWELTDEAIQEQVARESYLQWLQDCQKRDRRRPACTVTGPSCSGTDEQTVNWGENLSQARATSERKDRAALSPKIRSANSPKTRSSSGKTRSSSDVSGSNHNALHTSSMESSTPLDLSQETKTFLDFQQCSAYGYNDKEDENEALARAIAESQQVYLQNLRQNNH